MQCQNCGNEVYGNFCAKCGHSVQMPQPAIRTEQKSNTGLLVTALIVGGIAIVLMTVFLSMLIIGGAKDDDSTIVTTETEQWEEYPERHEPYDEGKLGKRPDEIYEAEDILNYNNNKYLYPSDRQYITVYELDRLTKDEVALVRNEIYARHGYSFANERYAEFFSQKSWYNPKPYLTDGADAEQYFNTYEKENKTTIVQYEKDMGWR